VRPDNGPWSLADFQAAGSTSAVAQLATSALARTVVNLTTGATVETRPGESPAQVVTRTGSANPIISDNGTSLLSNNGGGVISDNGGGVKPVNDGNHDLPGSYVVAYPYAPFAPPQPKFQLLQLAIPGAPLTRISEAGLREWLWPGMLQARAIAITGEALSDWTLTDNSGRFAIPLPPAMPLLFFLETQPTPGAAVQPFHEYALVFAPRGRVSLVGVDSSTSFNAVPFLYLTSYVDEQTTSGKGTLAALEDQVASAQSQVSSLQAQLAADPANTALQPQIDELNTQIAQLNARIAQLKALLAYLAQLEKDLDASKNQLDVTSVFRFLKNPAATSILASPDLKTAYGGLETESNVNAFTPVSYPLVNLP
jgi:hypothetical protein